MNLFSVEISTSIPDNLQRLLLCFVTIRTTVQSVECALIRNSIIILNCVMCVFQCMPRA